MKNASILLFGVIVGIASATIMRQQPPISPAPLQPSEDVMRRLNTMEEDMNRFQSALPSSGALQTLQKDFEDLLAKTPPLAQDTILPRLTSFQWSLRALATLVLPPVSRVNADSSEDARSLISLLDSAPPGVPLWLKDLIIKRSSDLEDARKTSLLAEAQRELQDKPDKERLYQLVSKLDALPSSDSLIAITKAQVAGRVLNLQLDVIAHLQDARLRQTAASNVYNAILGIRLSLAETRDVAQLVLDSLAAVTDRCELIISKAVAERQEKDAERLRNYQRWALKQITQFKDATSPNLAPKASDPLINTRDAMVTYLLPVDPRLLDPSVAQLYSEAHSAAWEKLKGSDGQLYIAKKAADVTKKTPQDLDQ